MSTFQKIATLIFRLIALALILYSCVAGAWVVFSFPPQALLFLLPTFLGGIVLYLISFPLAWFVTKDFGE